MVEVSFKWQLWDYGADRDETNNNYAEILSDSCGGDVILILPYQIREHKIMLKAIYKPQISYSVSVGWKKVTK